jgi:hypothetical protein
MGMPVVSDNERVFETLRPELMRSDPGRFAVICRERLLGIYDSVDEALSESSRAFDDGILPDGAPVLISEIAERVSVRVMARPVGRAVKLPGMIPAPWAARSI